MDEDMKIKSPYKIAETAMMIGADKEDYSGRFMNFDRLAIMSFAGGAFITLGAVLSLVVGYGFPEATAYNPALQRVLSGLVFPIGLVLVVVLGAELFTGNNALLIPALRLEYFGASAIVRNWVLVWIGNFAGAFFTTAFLVYAADITNVEPYRTAIIKIAVQKTELSWWVVLMRGIGANWCVCLAIWLAMAGHTLTEKVLGCWLPVMAFVILGYEHCVANMFFIPCGMLEGAYVTIGEMLWRNLLPATIGNIIGGAFFVGFFHGYIYLSERYRNS